MDSEHQDKVNDEEADYSDRRLKFFNSFEEMNEYDHRYYESLSYESRLSLLNSFLKQFYKAELAAKRGLGVKIFF